MSSRPEDHPLDGVSRVRFGAFELDLERPHLKRDGAGLEIQRLPWRILVLLVRSAGEVVSRESLRQELWPGVDFLEFDHNLNTAVSRLRRTLGDSARGGKLVQTVPGRGYRLSASPQVVADTRAPRQRTRRRLALAGSFGGLLAVIVVALLSLGPRPTFFDTPHLEKPWLRLVVVPLRAEADRDEGLAARFTDALTTSLGSAHPQVLGVASRSLVREAGEAGQALHPLARELGADFLLEGWVRRNADLPTATLVVVRLQDRTEIWTETLPLTAADIRAPADIARRVARSMARALYPTHHNRTDWGSEAGAASRRAS